MRRDISHGFCHCLSSDSAARGGAGTRRLAPAPSYIPSAISPLHGEFRFRIIAAHRRGPHSCISPRPILPHSAS